MDSPLLIALKPCRNRFDASKKRQRSRASRWQQQTQITSITFIAFVAFLALYSIPVAKAAIDEGGFGYEATTDVSAILNLAKDIRDMRESDLETKKDIYYKGKNALPLTLASLSTVQSAGWGDYPIHNMYRHAFLDLGEDKEGDEEGDFDGERIDVFADTLVADLFRLNLSRIEGEGALILNVLQACWSSLWDMLAACKRNDDQTQRDMLAALDRAVAYYVGADQVKGSSDDGYMLYNLAENAGYFFSQQNSESRINTLTLETFNYMQSDITNDACAIGASGYKRMRMRVQLAVRFMNTAMIQMLMHHVQIARDSDSSNFVELYSLALAPQIAACDTRLYDKFVELTIEQDVTDATRADIVSTIQESYKCFSISCADVGAYQTNQVPQCANQEFTPLVKYVPVSDVRRKAAIDRDIRLARMFLRLGSLAGFQDLYEYGWNSDVSLKELATGKHNSGLKAIALPSTSTYEIFGRYYGRADYDYVDAIIVDVVNKKAPFENTSPEQNTNVIIGMLQTTTMYLAVSAELDNALATCSENGDGETNASALSYWDGAAAYFIGSTEGSIPGGEYNGESIYGLGNQFCQDFGTCEPAGSVINEIVVNALAVGQTAMAKGACNQVRTIAEDTIIPSLLVPLIQGTILYAAEMDTYDGDTQSSTFGDLFAFGQAIQPELDEVGNGLAAQVKVETGFTNAVSPKSDRTVRVAQAIRTALEEMSTDCKDVGKLISGFNVGSLGLGLCPGDSSLTIPPRPTTSAPRSKASPHPDGLAWGRYTFSDTLVEERDSLFANDVEQMWNAENTEDAMAIYLRGRNALQQDIEVFPLTNTRADVTTLSQFSTESSKFMAQDPMYNFFRVALYEDISFEDVDAIEDSFPYAHNITTMALDPNNGDQIELGATAAVVLNVWMVLVNRLYEAVRQCKVQEDAPWLIDSAVALWIGQYQTPGSWDSGFMMYQVSQEVASRYGIQTGSETPVNSELMLLFNVAQSMASVCSEDDTIHLKLRSTVSDIVRELTKPLLQNLLYYMSQDHLDYVELFALAFVPQTISCDEGAHELLKQTLYEDFSRDTSIDEELIDAFAKVMQSMRLTCQDLGDTTNAEIQLKELVNRICTSMNVDHQTKYLAAYETSSDVYELARIDLDIHQIHLFMRAGAYEVAADYYEHGMNSAFLENGALLSLKQLATDPTRQEATDLYLLFTAYLKSDTYADDLIQLALAGKDQDNNILAGASRLQLSEIVFRTLQVLVTPMQIMANVYRAVNFCGTNAEEDLLTLVDEAAALFVGSIEGPSAGGLKSDFLGGGTLFALGKESCVDFDTCESSGDATVNGNILFSLGKIKDWIQDGDCDVARSIVYESIVPNLPVPIIQSTIALAFNNADLQVGTPESSFATGFIMSSAVLPWINSVDRSSAAIISENMDLNFQVKPVADGAMAVFDAFTSILTGMGVSCTSIGSLELEDEDLYLSTCEADTEVAPVSPTPIDLGDGLYKTTTYVQDRADIALDVLEMEKALDNNSPESADSIYKNGLNSNIYNSAGIKIGVRSLAGFSTSASQAMTNNPLFYTAVYALRDESGNYLGQDATKYADTIVQDSLEKTRGTRSLMAAEAAVALNVWMELANELFETLARCKKKMVADSDGVHSIDEAVAYWIGEGQIGGDRGHLLYALAEKMGDVFQINRTGQSRTNINILQLFNRAKQELSFPNACSENPNTFRRLKHIVDRITSQMMIVNIQALIHNLRVGDRPRVKVYAHAVVPLMATCRLSTFAYLKGILIDGDYREMEVEKIIQAIESTYPCFGIQCDDIGVHQEEVRSSCRDTEINTPLGGYRPRTDVRQFATLDYDIQELDILLVMQAYGPAEELYTYGKHARNRISTGSTSSNEEGIDVLSLSQLATSSSRSLVPQFDAFKRYFKGDANYADTLIQNALKDESLNAVQRRFIVTNTCQYMVVTMAALQAMEEAFSACQSAVLTQLDAKQTASMLHWDKAVALITGQMEGSTAGGSTDGKMLWALAKSQCKDYGTCSTIEEGSADAIDGMLELFYTGRGALMSSSCDGAHKAARELAELFWAPIIQGTLTSIYQLQGTKKGTSAQFQVWTQAYVLANSILPIVEDANRKGADTLSSNLNIDEKPLQAGAATVANALISSLQRMNVNCKDIGISDKINACEGDFQMYSPTDNVGLIVGLIVSIVAVCGIIFLIRAKGRIIQEKPEDNPVFVTSTNGEFNHAADDLIKKRPEEESEGSAATSTLLEKNDDDDDDIEVV